MKTKIIIEIDTAQLSGLSDQALAARWHIAQANPEPMFSQDAGALVELIGREIITRWLRGVPPELWAHQGNHHYWHVLQQNGKWLPVAGDDLNRQWVHNSQVPS